MLQKNHWCPWDQRLCESSGSRDVKSWGYILKITLDSSQALV